jgi:hypothetical protein
MFYHQNLALNGLFPGITTHRSVANLGHFEIEVIITPVPYSMGGGGYSYTPTGVGTDKYSIKIRITRKGKVWDYEKIVGVTTAKVFAKVIGKKITTPTISVLSTSMVEQVAPIIKVKIK